MDMGGDIDGLLTLLGSVVIVAVFTDFHTVPHSCTRVQALPFRTARPLRPQALFAYSQKSVHQKITAISQSLSQFSGVLPTPRHSSLPCTPLHAFTTAPTHPRPVRLSLNIYNETKSRNAFAGLIPATLFLRITCYAVSGGAGDMLRTADGAAVALPVHEDRRRVHGDATPLGRRE